MGLSNASGQTRILLAVLLWILILWLFTIGHPGFVPIAKFMIVVIILPYALVEWLKEKQLITKYLLVFRIAGLLLGGMVWYYLVR
ncbi:MAG: hypothetical protein AB1815_05115 [Bacillota bacterium]